MSRIAELKEAKFNYDGKEITIDLFMKNLATKLRGGQFPNASMKALREAVGILDINEDEIIVTLETDYDCIQCMSCCVYHELSKMADVSEDGYCKDCEELNYENKVCFESV